MIRLFLDANVYFAAFLSKEKGSEKQSASFLILELARRKKLALVATRLVLREADRNLRKKALPKTLKAFHRYLQETKIHVIAGPDERVMELYGTLIHPKDLPVLVAATESKANFLITLDKRHFFTRELLSKIKKIKILTSSDFVRDVHLKGKT